MINKGKKRRKRKGFNNQYTEIFIHKLHHRSQTNVWSSCETSPFRGPGAEQGKLHKDPRRGIVGPELSADQADTSPLEFCKAVRNSSKDLGEVLIKISTL